MIEIEKGLGLLLREDIQANQPRHAPQDAPLVFQRITTGHHQADTPRGAILRQAQQPPEEGRARRLEIIEAEQHRPALSHPIEIGEKELAQNLLRLTQQLDFLAIAQLAQQIAPPLTGQLLNLLQREIGESRPNHRQQLAGHKGQAQERSHRQAP